MATTLQTGSSAYPPPPAFSQESTASSVNGFPRSHSTMNSFEAPQSSTTTPTPTPPASRQQHLQYQFPNINGAQNSFPAPRAFQDNKVPIQQHHYASGQKPQIYTAVYSSVSVYEMEVDGLAVMKRRLDSWMNATQILKLAGIDKGKRTKVLEKEILNGEHEKVQGGYGKYQGTWISYNRAVQFAKGYGVLEALRPLLEYDMPQDGVSQGENLNTPTKEQAMAAQRKRNMMNGGMDRIPAQSPNGTFFKNISKSAANAVNAISKARFDSPAPRPASGGRPVSNMRRASQQMHDSQEYAGSSQQSMQSLHSENSFRNSQVDPALQQTDGLYHQNDMTMNGDEPPRKRMKASFSHDTDADGNDIYDTQMTDVAPTGGSFYGPGVSQSNIDYTVVGLAPLRQPTNTQALEKQQLLSSLFFDSSVTDFSGHPALTRLSGEDLDIPIDNTAHTALHWAATLARTSLARALVNKGASIYRLNTGGETSLIRAALTTNNLDQQSFPDLLELLGPTIEIRDGRGRTVLHHIAVSSAVRGPKRSNACVYYLESLLEFVVRSGSAANSQTNSFLDPSAQAPRPMGLARFMSEIVNSTDLSGDTALNLAARIGNKSIVKQLIEVGANASIPNRGGLRPMDFGVTSEGALLDYESNGQMIKASDVPKSRVTESSQELVNTLKSFIADTETSFNAQMREKQSLIDSAQSKLRESTALLAEERARLDILRQKSEKRKNLRQRIANLRQANEQARSYLISTSPSGPASVSMEVTVGEADAGLEVDTAVLSPTLPKAGPMQLNKQQKEYASQLPSAAVLRARASAYRQLNQRLEAEAARLKNQSSDLERCLRKVVALCTGVSEDRVDEMVAGLVKAVESEGHDEVEVGRVREFLRRVEGSSV